MGESDHVVILLDQGHAAGASMRPGVVGSPADAWAATALLADLISRDGTAWARQASLSMAP